MKKLMVASVAKMKGVVRPKVISNIDPRIP